MNDRVNQIMRAMGFPDTETGPYVTKLRESVARQVDRGLTRRSISWCVAWTPWSVGAETLTHEQRAKHLLAFDWEIENNRHYNVSAIDPIIRRRWNVTTNKTWIEVRWADIPGWIGDRLRSLMLRLRVVFDRVRGKRNPYLD